MSNQELIDKIAGEIKKKFEADGSGHDWWHIYRVWKMAKHIGANEKADMAVVELAALLHDVVDWKFTNDNEALGLREVEEILKENNVPTEITNRVKTSLQGQGLKGANVVTSTLEGRIIQDADRLDAIGAIGIARTFTYGGNKNRLMHDPSITPILNKNKEEYMKGSGTTTNHFYEKLLLLKDLMNTETGKKIAESRHKFMEKYLERFYKEWEGEI